MADIVRRRDRRRSGADDARGAVTPGLRHEGGGLSGEFLAAGLLSHAAPSISALFGGLLTKVGVYALLRTLVMLLPVDPRRCSTR